MTFNKDHMSQYPREYLEKIWNQVNKGCRYKLNNPDDIDACLDQAHMQFSYIAYKLIDDKVSGKAQCKYLFESKQVKSYLTIDDYPNYCEGGKDKASAVSSMTTNYNWYCYTIMDSVLTEKPWKLKKWRWAQIKSLLKFVKFVDSLWDICWGDEDCEKIYQQYARIECNYNNISSTQYNKSKFDCQFIEGFIMEGKSAEHTKKLVFDPEADIFWRLKLKDGRELPRKYVQVFWFYSLAKSYLWSLNHGVGLSNNNKFYMGRWFTSMALFEQMDDEKMDYKSTFEFWQPLFTNLVILFSNQEEPCATVSIKMNFQMPWPLLPIRQEYEGKIYPDELALNKKALWFYQSMHRIITSELYFASECLESFKENINPSQPKKRKFNNFIPRA